MNLVARITMYTLHREMKFVYKAIQWLIMRVTHSGMMCLKFSGKHGYGTSAACQHTFPRVWFIPMHSFLEHSRYVLFTDYPSILKE